MAVRRAAAFALALSCLPIATASAADADVDPASSAPFADSRGRFLAPLGQIPMDWIGIRSAGMGGSFTSIANDELAPFTNPAGLARTRNPRSRDGIHEIAFPGTAVGGSASAIAPMRGPARGIAGRMMEKTRTSPSKPLTAEAQGYPFIILGGKNAPTFLIGFPTRSQFVTRSAVTTAAPATATTAATTAGTQTLAFSETTAGAAFGVASGTRASLFSYGVSVRPNIRYTLLDLDAAEDLDSLSALKTQTGKNSVRTSAVAFDAGILLTAADFWFPTLGVAVRNIPTGCKEGYINPANGKSVTMCGAVRKKSSGSAPVDAATGKEVAIASTMVDPTEVRAGFSITPRGRVDGNKVNLRLAVDAYPLPISVGGKNYGVGDAALDRIVHAGAELYFGNALLGHGFALRAGFQDAHPTFGFTVNLFIVQLEFARYVVRTGLAEQSHADARYLLGLTTDW